MVLLIIMIIMAGSLFLELIWYTSSQIILTAIPLSENLSGFQHIPNFIIIVLLRREMHRFNLKKRLLMKLVQIILLNLSLEISACFREMGKILLIGQRVSIRFFPFLEN